MAAETTPRTKYKTFTYTVGTTWASARQGVLRSDSKPEVLVASPPEFKGVPGVWTPEDLFVAAVDTCQMTTFLALASRADLPLISYASNATGRLEFADGGYRFTRITLQPKIVVSEGPSREVVEQLVHDAHRACLVGRSVRCEIEVVPDIQVGS
jgi:organic hydroperoxide reductase OsmC/OhrA